MEYRKFINRNIPGRLISLPLIWAPFPIVLALDIIMEIYHQICFPIYGIEKVKRSMYIQIVDRGKLKYLTWYEKIGCMYCGYVNGFLLYAKEIAGRTEKYWCGIMHQDKKGFKSHQDQIDRKFSKFGDEEEFNRKYNRK